ncbi:MAG: hypothetical protein AAB661_01180, partial [Patescibacteria group bacterium]
YAFIIINKFRKGNKNFMAKNIFITATRQNEGKTVITLGLTAAFGNKIKQRRLHVCEKKHYSTKFCLPNRKNNQR